jgi:hypothetical protein
MAAEETSLDTTRVVAATQTLGVAIQGKSEMSVGLEVAYRKVFGVSAYSGGEKISGRGTQFGVDGRVYLTNSLLALYPDYFTSYLQGLGTYVEVGLFHVSDSNLGGSYNRIAGGGGFSYSFSLPQNIARLESLKFDAGYHTHRGIVAGVGVAF